MRSSSDTSRGECPNCCDGALGYCDQFRAINLFGNRPGGSALRRGGSELGGHFFAQSAFATHAIAATRNIVKVVGSGEIDFAAIAALLRQRGYEGKIVFDILSDQPLKDIDEGAAILKRPGLVFSLAG